MLNFPVAPVGRTSLKVTRIGLGTAPLGGMYTVVGPEQAYQAIDYAYAQGIRFFDTAPLYGTGLRFGNGLYGGGQAERYLGAALADKPRADYVLATKVGRLVTPDGGVVFNYSRDGILRSFEESLQRLGLERIDILHIHDADDHYHAALTETFPALAELREQGLIGAIGAGMNQWQMLADFARHADFDCFLLAGRYTLLEQTALSEFLPLCQTKGIGVFLGGVYNSGILARGPAKNSKYNYENAPAPIIEKVRRLEAVCQRYGVPLRAAAVQFPLAHPATTALILGVETQAELDQNLADLELAIPSQLWTDLQSEGLLDAAAPLPQHSPGW